MANSRLRGPLDCANRPHPRPGQILGSYGQGHPDAPRHLVTDTRGSLGGGQDWGDPTRAGSVRPSIYDTLYILRFIPLVDSEISALFDINLEAKKKPWPMRVIFGEHGREIAPGTRLASFVDLQNAINDPNMRGTLVIAHGGPGGVIWEVAPGEDPSDIEGESMSSPGFTDAHLEHNSPLAGRPATMRKPERVWLLGCKVGRLKTGWASTFGVAPQNLYAPMGFSAGKDPCIAKRTCEPTVPKLQQVLNWIRRRKQIQ